MLRAQGWQPGDYLGAKDAPHAEWHTEANTSHIRVVLKDDTLGLGAKRNNGDECTGLDAFQHLLGRLNGKSDETLETERKVREDVKLSLYVERKYGTIRFVKGGWLVGDVVKKTPDAEGTEDSAEVSKDSEETSDESEPAAAKSKKRKAEQDTDREDEKARKKEKKSKKRKAESDAEADSEKVKEKKDKKKEKKRRAESEENDEKTAAPSTAAEPLEDVASSDDVKKAKKEKKDKKEKKKEKRDKKEKTEKRRNDGPGSENSSTAPTPAESGISTPSGSGYSTPVTSSTRYLARSRFIAQKKMAFADSAALNQVRSGFVSDFWWALADIRKIFMIKS